MMMFALPARLQAWKTSSRKVPFSSPLQFQQAMIILKTDKITFIQNGDEAQI
jgi:hypothetical protein